MLLMIPSAGFGPKSVARTVFKTMTKGSKISSRPLTRSLRETTLEEVTELRNKPQVPTIKIRSKQTSII